MCPLRGWVSCQACQELKRRWEEASLSYFSEMYASGGARFPQEACTCPCLARAVSWLLTGQTSHGWPPMPGSSLQNRGSCEQDRLEDCMLNGETLGTYFLFLAWVHSLTGHRSANSTRGRCRRLNSCHVRGLLPFLQRGQNPGLPVLSLSIWF